MAYRRLGLVRDGIRFLLSARVRLGWLEMALDFC